ncbi:MAG: fibronectin type III domain-containing protein [Patescibacteria group bacterium]|nr:fibronectin type III domain-containing protein [Patescibacteria group bacterium]
MAKKPKGFTLVEILIVIAIIAILAGIVLLTILSVRARAQDAKRKSDLNSVNTALQSYGAGNNSYPISNPQTELLSNDSNLGGILVANEYFKTIPQDQYKNRQYTYESDGNSYKLCGILNDNSQYCFVNNIPADSGNSIAVIPPGHIPDPNNPNDPAILTDIVPPQWQTRPQIAAYRDSESGPSTNVTITWRPALDNTYQVNHSLWYSLNGQNNWQNANVDASLQNQGSISNLDTTQKYDIRVDATDIAGHKSSASITLDLTKPPYPVFDCSNRWINFQINSPPLNAYKNSCLINESEANMTYIYEYRNSGSADPWKSILNDGFLGSYLLYLSNGTYDFRLRAVSPGGYNRFALNLAGQTDIQTVTVVNATGHENDSRPPIFPYPFVGDLPNGNPVVNIQKINNGYLISWPEALDNSGVDHYHLKITDINNVVILETDTSDSQYFISNLNTGSTYNFWVTAYDPAGNSTFNLNYTGRRPSDAKPISAFGTTVAP